MRAQARDGVGDHCLVERIAQTGFEHELGEIVQALAAARVRNVVWLATDIHHAEVIRHAPRPGLTFHELIAGPLQASPAQPGFLDDTLGPTRLYAEGGFFNFGELRIQPVKIGFAAYYEELGRVGLVDEYGPKGYKQVNISGRDLRERLQKGELPDPRVMRPETARILIERLQSSVISNQ